MSIRFTLWNLFLAVIPVVAAHMLVRVERSTKSRTRTALLVTIGMVWMAFLPNTCYLMTEWRHFLFNAHFQEVRDATNPNDLSVLRVVKHAGFFLAYSGFGVVTFVLAIRPIVGLLRRHGVRIATLMGPFFFAVSLGVYLGLILRLNSWNLVTQPRRVVIESFRAIANPPLLAVMLFYAAVLWLLYIVIDIWFVGLEARLCSVRNGLIVGGRQPALERPADYIGE